MGKQKKEIDHDEIVRRFAARLREVRHLRGFSQAALAERAGVSEAYVGRLERAKAAPGIDLLEKLAVALATTAADLLPATTQPDAAESLREQARHLFESVVETEDVAALSLLVQLLARISETTAR